MKTLRPAAILLILLAFLSINCGRKSQDNQSRAVIGISSDIETLNPLYAFNINESYITDMLYLSLVQHDWNSATGEIGSEPMLAESWQWNSDSTSITIDLRKDVYWSDSVSVTAADVAYSFDLSSDPEVNSRFYGIFKNFYTDNDNHIDIKKTFDILSPYKLRINFRPASVPDLFSIDIPILPKHIFEKIKRNEIQHSDVNFNPVTDGPFRLSKWEKNQDIILKADKSSFLHAENSVDEIVFKIVPDYNTKLLQLKNGELDLITDVNPDDVAGLRKNDRINVVPIKGREYDYIGWNNIDPQKFANGKKVAPNPLLGDPNIRRALSYALNRKEVIDNFLYNNGEIAVGPIAPIFKSIFDSTLIPYEYNPAKAKELLAKEGWHPSPGNGILEKDGKKFSIKLFMGTGNPRREFAMAVFKNNLREIGVEVQVEKMEMSSFIQELFARHFDAWIAGWSVPIPIELTPYWHSGIESSIFNLSSYDNKRVDLLLEKLKTKISRKQRSETYREIQRIIHLDEPVTFLYWVDKIVAYNKRIKDIRINPLGAINKCWEWKISNN